MPRLENWYVGCLDPQPYQPPEAQHRQLFGQVFDHPRFDDGTDVHTSTIVEIDPVNETVKTYSGSIYTLGAVDPKYEAAFPNAREKFFKQCS